MHLIHTPAQGLASNIVLPAMLQSLHVVVYLVFIESMQKVVTFKLMTCSVLQYLEVLLDSSLHFLQQMQSVTSPALEHLHLVTAWTALVGLPYSTAHLMMVAGQQSLQVSLHTDLYAGQTDSMAMNLQ